MSVVVKVENLEKTYSAPFKRTKTRAVKGISFEVNKGEVFGFLGPNGAGKTTTIRMLMGLISPTAGTASLFGHRVPSREARVRLGFLPESPYFYEYLSINELLDLTGRLFSIDKGLRKKRAGELVELVGLGHAANKPLKSYSKGMLQRAGIAQALVNDPELVVFDEPMGGLDPIGRKEVRDIILSLRDQGKTVFFSSHILADVETIADRICIIVRGEIHGVGDLREMVGSALRGIDIVARWDDELSKDDLDRIEKQCHSVRWRGRELSARLDSDGDIDKLLHLIYEIDGHVSAVVPHHDTLEDVFMRLAEDGAKTNVNDDAQKDDKAEDD